MSPTSAARIALAGAIIILAGCGQDPSGPTTAPGVAPIDRTADARPQAGITIRLFADDAAAVGVPMSFTIFGGRKPQDYMLAAGGVGTNPTSINIFPLAPDTYTFSATLPAGFDFFESNCGASDGSTITVAAVDLVFWELAKRGYGFCDITIGTLP